MHRWLPLLAGTLLVLLGGVAHGLWSNRWGDSRALETAAKRLELVPRTIGNWVGRDQEMDARALAIGEIVGHVYRRYEDRRTGQGVTLLLVCGKSGPIAVHTPDVCYGGLGYALTAPPAQQAVPLGKDAEPATFWSATVRKETRQVPVTLHVLWAWNAAGRWEAPDNPRLKFGRYPALYKLYIIRELPPNEDASALEPSIAFLQQLVPELRRSLGTNPAP